MSKIFAGIVLVVITSSSCFSQTSNQNKHTNYLYELFARSYLSGQFGLFSSKTEMVATNQNDYNYHNPVVMNIAAIFSYGHHLKGRFWLQFNVGLSRFRLLYKRKAPYGPLSHAHTYTAGKESDVPFWSFSAFLSYYYPLVGNRIYLCGKAGPTLIRVNQKNFFAPTMSFPGLYWDWLPHKYMPGFAAGLEVDFRIGKRLLLFGSYSFNHLLFNTYSLHEHNEYYSYTGKVILYYDAEVKPYNDIFTIGAKFSLENSLFYKKKKKIGKNF